MSSRTAVVTGGSRGIGLAVVLALREKGVRVASLSSGNNCHAADLSLPCDVRDEGQVRDSLARVRDALGSVDILVNSAGVSAEGLVHDISLEAWNRVLSVNLTGSFLLMRQVLPDMLARGWGRIVNVSSILGKMGSIYQGAYAASKHGLVGLTRAAAMETADKGITVNAVCPGIVDTDMTREISERLAGLSNTRVETVRRIAVATNPQRRMLLPAEVAATVRFLASDEAAGINGQALNHCGGRVFA